MVRKDNIRPTDVTYRVTVIQGTMIEAFTAIVLY